MNQSIDDPFEILGIAQSANEEAIRARYLELVKTFPPEREPERFRQIHAAYAAAKEPLRIARALLQAPDTDDPPEWSDVIQQYQKRPPNLNVNFLLSLGNRHEEYSSDSPRQPAPDSTAASILNDNSQQVFVDPAHE